MFLIRGILSAFEENKVALNLDLYQSARRKEQSVRFSCDLVKLPPSMVGYSSPQRDSASPLFFQERIQLRNLARNRKNDHPRHFFQMTDSSNIGGISHSNGQAVVVAANRDAV